MTKAEVAVLVRIGLYVLSGALLSAGAIDGETTSLLRSEQVLGVLTLVGSLGWWRLAKRFGWAT